jgi:hypothetical protein
VPDFVLQCKHLLISYLKEKTGDPLGLDEELIGRVFSTNNELGEHVKQLMQECDRLLYAPGLPDAKTRILLLRRISGIIETGNLLWN